MIGQKGKKAEEIEEEEEKEEEEAIASNSMQAPLQVWCHGWSQLFHWWLQGLLTNITPIVARIHTSRRICKNSNQSSSCPVSTLSLRIGFEIVLRGS